MGISESCFLPPAMQPNLLKFRISEKKVEKFLWAIAFSRYLFPSSSYVFEKGENPKFRSISSKKEQPYGYSENRHESNHALIAIITYS